MSRAGAPLRFLGLVLGGWMTARAAMLWPTLGAQALVPAPIAPIARVAAEALAALVPAARAEPLAMAPPPPSALAAVLRPATATYVRASAVVTPPVGGIAPAPAAAAKPDARYILALASFVQYGDPAPPDRPAPSPSRLSASAWGILRSSGSSGGAVVTPQLGGSQAGMRFAYALDGARRLAATLRVAGALGQPDRELAPGIEWRVPHTPVRLFAEQRIALARGRGGTTVGAILGVSRTLPAGFALEGYAQGGVIARDGAEGFVDAAARASRRIIHAGGIALDVGLGAWGAAQRGAARVDVGPTVGVVVPVAGAHLRLSADWRQRIAGNARPASGPALSIGADF